MFLLDTNACIRLLNGSCAELAARLRTHAPSEVCLCSVVKAELLYGARHSARVADNLRLLERFFSAFASLPFDDACAEQYGQIRGELEATGTPIGPNDLLIASVARTHGLTLVTHNVDEFSRVIGLRLEDWEQDTA
ncbi:MAG: type II toxin-antitoxin system VapC family toxin [Thermoanaerobaculaceae bacterium]|jgi:tRNA(fMet)-specific endonuclease VapC|nr:type II toxin-antitoxin system VapC family toxin [Thermoanaerobaculaceae bacterium]